MKKLMQENPVLRIIVITTAAFFLLLAIVFGTAGAMPGINTRRAERAIEGGEFDRARRCAEKLDDESARRELLNLCDYSEACFLTEQSIWEDAAELFLSLGDYEDSQVRLTECRYRQAEELAESGEYERAAEMFSGLGAYLDSQAKANSARYALAEEALKAGDGSRAFSIFLELGDYSDAYERAGETAMSLTGLGDPEAAINSLRGLSPEALEKQARLAALRSELPQGIVAVGFYHSLALRADGTVLGCGDNEYGQCETAGWHDVTAVAAGAYHSLALHSDGTVSATGRSGEGQCDVESWRNVIKIAATDWSSLALTSDGKILFCGFNDFSGLENLPPAADIFGGSYSAALLLPDGSFVVDPMPADAGLKNGAVSIAAGTGFVAVLYPDGSVTLSTDGESFGENAVAVSACDAFVLTLDSEGTVSGRAFRSSAEPDVSGLRDIVAMDAGSTHCAYVTSGGELILRGDNSRGQLDLSGAKLY